LNPCSGMLGDYSVVRALRAGNNRVRVRHSSRPLAVDESPKFEICVQLRGLISPGQNRTYTTGLQSHASPDCNRWQSAWQRQSVAQLRGWCFRPTLQHRFEIREGTRSISPWLMKCISASTVISDGIAPTTDLRSQRVTLHFATFCAALSRPSARQPFGAGRSPPYLNYIAESRCQSGLPVHLPVRTRGQRYL